MIQPLLSGIRDPGSGIRDSGLGIRDSGLGIRDSGLGIRDSGFDGLFLSSEAAFYWRTCNT